MGKRRWHGAELARLRLDYEHSSKSMADIARQYGTSLGQLARLVRKHHFNPRRGNPRDPKLRALRARRTYIEGKIEQYRATLASLNSKIGFLEAINARNPRDDG